MSRSDGTTLNDVCEFIVDCLHKTAPIQESGYPLIRTPNIGAGRLLLDEAHRVSEDTYAIWTQRAVPRPGDLILAREAPAGNVAIIKDGETVCLGQRTVHLRPDKARIDPAFLCYFLLAPEQQGKLLAGETGATSKHVNMSDIRKLQLTGLPDLKAQQKIGATAGAYDDHIQNNRRRIQLLEQTARLLYREWFIHLRFPGHGRVRIVDGVPAGWRRAPLGDALTLQRGFDLPSSQRSDGSVPVYGSTGINGYHGQAMVLGPGVITGRSGSLGQVMYVSGSFWPLNTSLWVKDFKLVSPQFAYFLLAGLGLEQFNGGAAVPTLNRNDVHRIEVLLPPKHLMDVFSNTASDLLQQTEKLRQLSAKLAEARDLLLPRLMSGEIKV